MNRYSERAVVRDSDLMANFRQGFEEGLAEAGEQLVYGVRISFQGTELNERDFGELADAMAYVGQHLKNGSGAQALITCRPAKPGEAAVEAPMLEEGIVEAEIVE
jgi:hypothetical protein